MNDRRSVNAFFSIAAEQDVEVEDDLARGAYLPLLRHLLPPGLTSSSPEASQRP